MKTSERSGSSEPKTAASCKRKTGRKKFRETRHPVYRGVRERNGGKWVCEVREPLHKTRIWLGTYPTPELAGRAHDVAALALKGEAATLNFPDSAWVVPRAKSCSASDIRTAALHLPAAMKPIVGADEVAAGGSSTGFWDEEAVFNMPGLIDRMAEAMLLTPPAYKQPYFKEDHSSLLDFNLWG